MITDCNLSNLFSRWDRRGGPIPLDELRGELGRLAPDREDFSEYVHFNERSYQRVLIRRGPSYEALILCWRSGQRSPIHDHSGSACVVCVLEGTATETTFEPSPCGRLVPVRSCTAPRGSLSACYDSDIHQMANLEPTGRDLITLHVYSPPLVGMRLYSVGETTLADHDEMIALRSPTIMATAYGSPRGESAICIPALKD